MTEVTRCSCWHLNFILKGLPDPAPGLCICIQSWKNCIKSDLKEIFFKLVANDWSDKRFLLTSEYCPLRLTAPDLQLYTLNHEKMCIKSEVEEIRFKLATMTIVMSPSCWHQNFGPNGLCAPAQRLCLNFFSLITTDFNISSALRWAIQAQWTSGSLIALHSNNFGYSGSCRLT